jgi:exodeoxyribonuclease VII small subunit
MPDATDITFEQGYRRLEQIAELVNSDKVSVDQMCELFAEGKGLDRALSAYLAEQKGRIERIERGEEIQAFRIVAESAEPGAGELRAAANGGSGPVDDDIPF